MTAHIKDTLQQRLRKLGLELPAVTNPGGNYQSVNIRGSFAFVAIQFPIADKQYLFRGRLGVELPTAEGYKASQLCALNILAQMNSKVGFDQVIGLNHIDVYFQSAEWWDDAPLVADGASDLFVNVLGEAGHHSRALLGVARLPRNFAVALTCSFTLR